MEAESEKFDIRDCAVCMNRCDEARPRNRASGGPASSLGPITPAGTGHEGYSDGHFLLVAATQLFGRRR
jgi:hypothetical protein